MICWLTFPKEVYKYKAIDPNMRALRGKSKIAVIRMNWISPRKDDRKWKRHRVNLLKTENDPNDTSAIIYPKILIFLRNPHLMIISDENRNRAGVRRWVYQSHLALKPGTTINFFRTIARSTCTATNSGFSCDRTYFLVCGFLRR